MLISAIVAADENNGIGKQNELLCHLPADLKHFKKLTSGHHIIMGRKTYESIGRPLPNRTNVILTRQQGYTIPGCEVVHTIEEALNLAKENQETEAFIIGGAEIYKTALPILDKIYLTRIHHTFEADAFFPALPSTEWQAKHMETFAKDDKHLYSFDIKELTRL